MFWRFRKAAALSNKKCVTVAQRCLLPHPAFQLSVSLNHFWAFLLSCGCKTTKKKVLQPLNQASGVGAVFIVFFLLLLLTHSYSTCDPSWKAIDLVSVLMNVGDTTNQRMFCLSDLNPRCRVCHIHEVILGSNMSILWLVLLWLLIESKKAPFLLCNLITNELTDYFRSFRNR